MQRENYGKNYLQPYKGAPETMGIFATRSPMRPNPIALTAVEVIHIDLEHGKIQVPFIDADDNKQKGLCFEETELKRLRSIGKFATVKW